MHFTWISQSVHPIPSRIFPLFPCFPLRPNQSTPSDPFAIYTISSNGPHRILNVTHRKILCEVNKNGNIWVLNFQPPYLLPRSIPIIFLRNQRFLFFFFFSLYKYPFSLPNQNQAKNHWSWEQFIHTQKSLIFEKKKVFLFFFPIPRTEIMSGIVVVFDFDKTIVDVDSDNWVIDELGFTDLFNQLLPTMPWNTLMVSPFVLTFCFIKFQTFSDLRVYTLFWFGF